jgi:DNA topoisomerase-1
METFSTENKENSLSAGRCRTPALRLVYDNEIERQSKKIEYKYKIEATFFQKKMKFSLSTEFEDKCQVLEFLAKSKTHQHIVSIGEKKTSAKYPPTPFNTSSLLQSASSVLDIRPKETMSLCQQLYQDGLITYMGTESRGYAGDFIQIAFGYISSKFMDTKYLRNREEIENIDDKNPHEAIRVTNIHTESIVSENSKAATLYRLIWRNTIQNKLYVYCKI